MEVPLHNNSLQRKDKPLPDNIGSLLYRNTYHYWYHIGEAHAVRQLLGHPDLPQFVGDMSQALYRPEQDQAAELGKGLVKH